MKELINDHHSSYTSRAPALEHPLDVHGKHSFTIADQYSINTIASCKDFPLPHTAKNIFIEPEQEVNTAHTRDVQQKQRISFLKRLTLANIKAEISEFLNWMRDTLSSWKGRVVAFITNKPQKKAEAAPRKTEPSKTETQEAVPASGDFSLDDIENRRIREVEDTSAVYEEELARSGGGDMNAMIELACRMAILVGSLGYRLHQKEIKIITDYLEVNNKHRGKTYEGGRTWIYVSAGLYFASAVLSLGSLGGFAGEASKVGKILSGLGQYTAQPVGNLATGAGKFSEIDSEKKQGRRAGFEYEGEKLKQTRSDRDRSSEKTTQLMQSMIEAWRNMNQTKTQSVKQAAAG